MSLDILYCVRMYNMHQTIFTITRIYYYSDWVLHSGALYKYICILSIQINSSTDVLKSIFTMILFTTLCQQQTQNRLYEYNCNSRKLILKTLYAYTSGFKQLFKTIVAKLFTQTIIYRCRIPLQQN
jgi:hypothetical protein